MGVYRWNIDPRGMVKEHSYATEMRYDDLTKPAFYSDIKIPSALGGYGRQFATLLFNGESAARTTVAAISYKDFTSDVELKKVGRYVFNQRVYYQYECRNQEAIWKHRQ